MRATIRKTAPLTLALVATLTAPPAPGTAAAVPRPELRINTFAGPAVGNLAGRDMPAYVAFSQNTRIPGETATVAPRDLVSNLVALPREQWGGGVGADDWSPSLGVLAGSLFPYPEDQAADSFYFWSGISKGQLVTGGNDTGLSKLWFTGFRTAQIGYEPTGRAGSLTWQSTPEMARVVRSTTTAYQGSVLPDGTGVRSPVPVRFTRAMYLNHANVFAQGGDVDAKAAAVVGPTFTFRQEVPTGTVMNAQLVGYSRAGPWANAQVSIDFNAGLTSGPSGEWRLPVTVTAAKGSFIPERRDVPWEATPQFTIPFTTVGLPLVPEEAGTGANDVHLVADPDRWTGPMTYVAAIRQPDGSQRIHQLDVDQPGRHVWRIRDGRLEEIAAPGSAALLAAAGASEEAAAATAEDPYPTGARVDPSTGRPTFVDVRVGGRAIAERYDVARVRTPEGAVSLGPDIRDGRLVWREEPDGDASATAAYRIGKRFVLAKLYAHSGTFRSYVYGLSLDGDPHPTRIEADVTLADGAAAVDRLSGPLEREMDLLQTPLAPRLVVTGGPKEIPVEPAQNGIEVRTDVRDAGPGPGLDRVRLRPSVGLPDIWQPGVQWLQWGTPADPMPAANGAFTAMKLYRIAPEINDDPPIGGGPIEETRDLDGNEGFALAFTARRADGTAIRQTDVKNLFLTLMLPDGTRLFTGSFSSVPWTPDDGTSWGLRLIPLGELPSTEVIVYARVTHAGGLVTPEASQLAADEWRFAIDRAPIAVTSTEGGVVTGSTVGGSSVAVSVPELGLEATGIADAAGAFSVPVDLGTAPSGDYEAVVRVVTPVPEQPERTLSNFVLGATDLVPDDERGSVTARIRHAAGGSNPAAHRSGPTVDRDAASSFLASRLSGGAFDGSLRATRWGVSALDDAPAEAEGYLSGLATGGGYGWRRDTAASASASGLAASALAEIGAGANVTLLDLLRWDGLAGPDATRDATSLEGTALLLLGLHDQGKLGDLDPWWRERIAARLRASQAGSPAEAYARSAALRALGEEGATMPAGDDSDAVAYRALLGEGGEADLAPYQLTDAGFSHRRDGDRAEALATALALAAVRG